MFGNRVAAKDLENCLEDVVSIFEASLKVIVRRAFSDRGEDEEQVRLRLKRIGNSFQSIHRTREQLSKLFSYECGPNGAWERMALSFEKRHPVTHNLGVVDKKYLERVQRAEHEGREVRISEGEVMSLIDDVRDVISNIHHSLLYAAV